MSWQTHANPCKCKVQCGFAAGLQTMVMVHNDAVPALVSGTEGQLEGCVLIAGTGEVMYCCLFSGRDV